MYRNPRVLILGGLLASQVVFLTGCEKVKQLTQDLKKNNAPAHAATYSSEQIRPVDTIDNYASFTGQKDRLVIIDFYADWCAPCAKLGPVLEKATQLHPGVVYLGKVNVDKAGELAAQKQVSSIPDVRIFKNGVQVDQFVGFPGEAAVLEKISTLAEGISPVAAPTAPAAPPEPKVKPMEKSWMPAGMEKR